MTDGRSEGEGWEHERIRTLLPHLRAQAHHLRAQMHCELQKAADTSLRLQRAVIEMRIAANVSQQCIADEYGCTVPYVSQIENGDRPLTEKMLTCYMKCCQ